MLELKTESNHYEGTYMNIVILEGYVNNPGDLYWDALRAFGNLTIYDRTSRQQLAKRIAEADIVVSSKTMWDDEAFSWAPRLKMIALTSTGFNVVDLDCARKHDVIVSNVPAYSTCDVAQMALALILELCLHVGLHSNMVKDGAWMESRDFTFWKTPLIELSGKTLGVIGMGNTGTSVAHLGRAFGMNVLFFNRSIKKDAEDTKIQQVNLDELLNRADVISLHLAAAPETDGIINAAALAKMKPGVLLVNTARGTLVDEKAVADALISGQLGGFATDVVSVEPMQPDNPLLQAHGDNLIITPHIAWATHEARKRLLDTVAANVGAFVAGNPCNVVS